MTPCGCEVASVDGLPSGECGGVGEDQGEMLAAAGGERVVQAVLKLSDVGIELRGDSGGAEPAVKQAD